MLIKNGQGILQFVLLTDKIDQVAGHQTIVTPGDDQLFLSDNSGNKRSVIDNLVRKFSEFNTRQT